jgi:hypothetical protein
MDDSDDLKDVISQEKRRGRRPIDIEAHRLRLRLLKAFREALKLDDEALFKETLIHELGQLPGSPEYRHSLSAWHSLHRKPYR